MHIDSQSTVDHLRDEANARKDTTLGELLDTAAEELDQALEELGELRKQRDTEGAFLGMVERFGERICRTLEAIEMNLRARP